jgi:hypothetical protein
MRELKKASSVWIHENIGLDSFGGQDGYAGYTVSVPALTHVKGHIDNQSAHHVRKTYREELAELLDCSMHDRS